MFKGGILCCVAVCLALLTGNALARHGGVIIHQGSELTLTKVDVQGVTYDQVGLSSLLRTMTPGAPEQPAQTVYLVIPNDLKVDGVQILSAAADTLTGNYNVYPCQRIVV